MVKSKDETEIKESPVQSQKETAKQMLHKFIEEETQLVSGRFRNIENPGCSQTIECLKYPGVPKFKKEMMDGQVYKIPLWVARHLNGVDVTAGACGGKINSCAYPTHGFQHAHSAELPSSKFDEGGNLVPIIRVDKWNRRYAFESLEFDVAI